MKADYVIRNGETLFLALDATEGDTSLVDTVVARLKPAGPNGSVPGPSVAAVAVFTVIRRLEEGDIPEGWDLIISDEETETIKPGFYITDAKLTYTSGVAQKTEPVLIEIKGGVS